MAEKSQQISVSNTVVTQVDPQPDKDRQSGSWWSCYNPGTNRIWFGDSAVVAGQGIPVEAGGQGEQYLPAGAHVYAIAENAATPLNVFQVGV